MPTGYRGVVLAFGLILCGASAAPKESAAPKQQEAAQQPKQAAPKVADMASEPPKAVEPLEYYQPCAEAKYKGRSDLCAQWSAAKAAEEAADWAWWQMWLSALGVIGLGITLWFNFRALTLAEKESVETKDALATAQRNAASAGRAAKAAGEANAIAREAMQRQMRPYVYAEPRSIKYTHMASVGYIGDTAPVVLQIKNFGSSPARKVTLRARTFVGGVWNAPFEHDLDDATLVHMADIPPQADVPAAGYTVLGLKEAHGSIISGNASVFIEGQIQYQDGFGNEYFTNFRLASTEGDYHAEKFAACPQWNDAI